MRLFVAALCSLILSCSLGSDASSARVRSIILGSRQLGAHGLGYGERSLNELARKLTPEDVQVLVTLLPDRELSVGVQFALASQCEHAISVVQTAAATHRTGVLEASNVMSLISSYQGCSLQARSRAQEALGDLNALREARQGAAKRRVEEGAAQDARIQENALRMARGGKAAQGLTREQREEVFHRSLQAMGLRKDGPMTAEQKALVDRMYRTMVLGEPANPSSSNRSAE